MSRCNRFGGSASIIALLGVPAFALDDEIKFDDCRSRYGEDPIHGEPVGGLRDPHSCSVGIGPEQGIDLARDWIADQLSRIY